VGDGRSIPMDLCCPAGDGRSSAGDGRSSAGDGRSSAGDGRSSAGDGRSSAGDGRSSANETSSNVAEFEPLAAVVGEGKSKSLDKVGRSRSVPSSSATSAAGGSGAGSRGLSPSGFEEADTAAAAVGPTPPWVEGTIRGKPRSISPAYWRDRSPGPRIPGWVSASKAARGVTPRKRWPWPGPLRDGKSGSPSWDSPSCRASAAG
jgi:hypothetical protein